jgi:hypothetical protein
MLALPFVAVWAAGPAVTLPTALDVDLDYSAPAECPDGERFRALLAGFVPRARSADEGERPVGPRIVVRIAHESAGPRGTLRLFGRQATTEARELAAATCAEVAEGLALTAALAISPDEVAVAPAQVAREQAVETPAPASWWVGAAAGAEAPIAAVTLASAGLSVERRVTRRFGVHAPDLALDVRHARNDVVGAPGDARFTLSSATLAACPVGGALGEGFAASACAALTGGVIEARGIAIAHPTDAAAPWVAIGATARASRALGQATALSLVGALERPMRPIRFHFDLPERPVAVSAAATWRAAIELDMRFR